jgi:hypothetical protein
MRSCKACPASVRSCRARSSRTCQNWDTVPTRDREARWCRPTQSRFWHHARASLRARRSIDRAGRVMCGGPRRVHAETAHHPQHHGPHAHRMELSENRTCVRARLTFKTVANAAFCCKGAHKLAVNGAVQLHSVLHRLWLQPRSLDRNAQRNFFRRFRSRDDTSTTAVSSSTEKASELLARKRILRSAAVS